MVALYGVVYTMVSGTLVRYKYIFPLDPTTDARFVVLESISRPAAEKSEVMVSHMFNIDIVLYNNIIWYVMTRYGAV